LLCRFFNGFPDLFILTLLEQLARQEIFYIRRVQYVGCTGKNGKSLFEVGRNRQRNLSCLTLLPYMTVMLIITDPNDGFPSPAHHVFILPSTIRLLQKEYPEFSLAH
jgi:hypothetical protein